MEEAKAWQHFQQFPIAMMAQCGPAHTIESGTDRTKVDHLECNNNKNGGRWVDAAKLENCQPEPFSLGGTWTNHNACGARI